jgi:hypothetical protein
MTLALAESFLLLLRFEIVMAFRTLGSLHRQVHAAKVARPKPGALAGVQELCHEIDLACVFYPKRVFCLQRSAATVLLLRRHGVMAHMMIGAQMQPFRSHAWVEVDGIVVNDKPYMREIYQILENC